MKTKQTETRPCDASPARAESPTEHNVPAPVEPTSKPTPEPTPEHRAEPISSPIPVQRGLPRPAPTARTIDRRVVLTVGGGAAAGALVLGGAQQAFAKDRSLPPGTVVARLDKDRYRRGEAMTLTVRTSLRKPATTVVDSSGVIWQRVSADPFRRVYTATAGDEPTSRVRVTVARRRDGATAGTRVDYAVAHTSSGHGGGGRWPGHVPGKIVLGLSSSDFAASIAAIGPVGLRRSFYEWTESGEDAAILADHRSGRLPWVSFKPPGRGTSGWDAVASGAYDADIKAMARRYASYSDPVVSTFHHEPTNEGGDPAQWAAAWVRIYDLMNAETGLANVTFAPILGDWEFNPRNRDRRPDAFLTPAVLERIPFLGIDLYQNAGNDGFARRLARIVDWLDFRGVADPMVGIGETGCCLAEDPQPQQWLQANWDWSLANVDQIGLMSYFDSQRNSKDRHVWSLNETQAKTDAYKGLLASTAAVGLV